VGIGVVVSGFANTRRAIVGKKVCIGPVIGSFIKTHVKSAQIARTNVSSVVAGNDACLALALHKDEKKLIRKGMVQDTGHHTLIMSAFILFGESPLESYFI